ncbi:MAG: hypothetical protein AAGN82_20645 [Myxococcota bacterium]
MSAPEEANSEPASVRDGQLRSGFTPILERFLGTCLGGVAVLLVDEEGEGVDLAAAQGAARPSGFDIRVTGAHWQIVFRQVREQRETGLTEQLWVRAAGYDYVVVGLPYDYVLCIICRPGRLDDVSHRALRQAEVELCTEAGWTVPRPEQPCWRRVQIRTDRVGRPLEMRLDPDPAQWSGRFAEVDVVDGATGRLERAYVAAKGPESGGRRLHLVRERSGFWYAREASRAFCGGV